MEHQNVFYSPNKEVRIYGEVELYSDYQENPIQKWDMLGTLALHPNWSHIANERITAEAGNCPDDTINNHLKSVGLSRKDVVLLPVWKYQHGGISFLTVPICRFDSSFCGVFYVTKKKLRKAYGVNRLTQDLIEKAKISLQAELNTFNQWLSGEIYSYVITKETLKNNGWDKEVEIIDSCIGYYDENQCKEDMNSSIEDFKETMLN